MADITVINQGEVESSGKVNWRGDQVSVPQGGQSIFKTASIPLAELGERKVVGDRVFRYAKAGGTCNAGDVLQYGGTAILDVTAGNTDAAGGKTFTWYAATTVAANAYAEGYLFCQTGTDAGYMYRIKSHAAIATTSTGILYLYDELRVAPKVADKWSVYPNPYLAPTQMTAGTAPAVGVAPIAVTTGDYFWLQTWGPCSVLNGTSAPTAGAKCQPSLVGACATSVGTGLGSEMGFALMTMTATEQGLVWLKIAP